MVLTGRAAYKALVFERRVLYLLWNAYFIFGDVTGPASRVPSPTCCIDWTSTFQNWTGWFIDHFLCIHDLNSGFQQQVLVKLIYTSSSMTVIEVNDFHTQQLPANFRISIRLFHQSNTKILEIRPFPLYSRNHRRNHNSELNRTSCVWRQESRLECSRLLP